MKITATKFRENLFKLLDAVAETGIPIEIERKGYLLKVVSEKPKSKISNLAPHSIIRGNPEDLIKTDWVKEWDGGKNL